MLWPTGHNEGGEPQQTYCHVSQCSLCVWVYLHNEISLSCEKRFVKPYPPSKADTTTFSLPCIFPNRPNFPKLALLTSLHQVRFSVSNLMFSSVGMDEIHTIFVFFLLHMVDHNSADRIAIRLNQ